LAVAGNVFRLLIIVLAAKWWGKDAGDWVHGNTIVSLLPYVPAVLALLWLGNLLEKKNPTTEAAA
jgi:exosortase/archaeosortase family protein